MAQEQRFPWPEEIEVPEGCEGWREMYPDQLLFGDDNREDFEKQFFWFQNGTQGPRPYRPWNTIFPEMWQIFLSQFNSRVFAVPPAMGVQMKVVNGYLYFSPVPTLEEAREEEREEVFRERSRQYFEDFPELFEEDWLPKVKAAGRRIDALEVPDELPEYSPDAVVDEARGRTVAGELLKTYYELQEHLFDAWQYHFEFLNLAYLAYLTFYDFCQEAFPGITDETIGQMVSAIEETYMFKPEEKLNELAELAVDLGDDVADVLVTDASPETKLDRLEGTAAGREWLEAFEAAKEPWFRISEGNPYYRDDEFWIHNLETPFDYLRARVERLQSGEALGRSYDEIEAERERIVEEYRGYLETEELKQQFDETYGVCRTIYAYTEDHNFWVDNWVDSFAYETMDAFGELLVEHGFLDDPEDIYLFNRHEVAELLSDLATNWALGPAMPAPAHWKETAAERADILDAMEDWVPEPALGDPPEEITEPFTVMLWGITTETVEGWLSDEAAGERSRLEGFPSSTGEVEGRARVVFSADDLEQVEEDEILICPATNPTWAPIFPRIKAAITDSGGTASHAAIVCREYGLPAVTGTGVATKTIETGDRVRVDGSEGTVEIVERAAD
ncbi:MAG: PEP-utilizing enzyme [Halobacteriales archaeon]